MNNMRRGFKSGKKGRMEGLEEYDEKEQGYNTTVGNSRSYQRIGQITHLSGNSLE